MSFVGHMKNGVVVFDSPVPIPDGAEVRVDPVVESNGEHTSQDAPEGSLYDLLKDIIGKARTLPPDMSVNHDHYLYGTPKQQP